MSPPPCPLTASTHKPQFPSLSSSRSKASRKSSSTKLRDLKYTYRPDIRDRATLGAELPREVRGPQPRHASPTASSSACSTRSSRPTSSPPPARSASSNSFTRDDGTPLNYTLVNIKDWCKNTFEVVSQLRINTDYSHHRYDVILLINGVPVVQIELKTLGINPRRAMEQIVEYKNDPGNGYTRTLLCFVQLFIVSNRDRHLVLRQQQRPPLRLQRRRAVPARSTSSPPRTTRRSPTSTTSPTGSSPSARSAR